MQITSRTRDAARSLSLAWVVLVVAVVAVGWLLTGPLEPTVDPWDDSVVEAIADRRTPTMDVVAAWGSHVADTIVGVIVAAVAALVLWRTQGTRRPLVYFALLVVGTLALYLVVTLVISRSRPPVEILDPGLVPEH
ncbi:MAG TPA: hypothetical protein VGV65_06575, partial [Nocardioides sp.]|nr:hypothetical protein [Nocardioides sp.]